MDPSLQMRGQSPMNCPVSDVKMWGQNLTYCLMTKEKAALIHTLMLLLTNTKLQRTFQYTRRYLPRPRKTCFAVAGHSFYNPGTIVTSGTRQVHHSVFEQIS